MNNERPISHDSVSRRLHDSALAHETRTESRVTLRPRGNAAERSSHNSDSRSCCTPRPNSIANEVTHSHRLRVHVNMRARDTEMNQTPPPPRKRIRTTTGGTTKTWCRRWCPCERGFAAMSDDAARHVCTCARRLAHSSSPARPAHTARVARRVQRASGTCFTACVVDCVNVQVWENNSCPAETQRVANICQNCPPWKASVRCALLYLLPLVCAARRRKAHPA